jgi:hypothetical protein
VAWHAEDWRADVAAFLAGAPQTAVRRARRTRAAVREWRAERALAETRSLVYESPYISTIGDCLAIDGYFRLPGGLEYGLQVVAVGASYREYVADTWERGGVLTADTNLLNGDHSLYVPVETLDDAIVVEAIERWYAERFRYVRRHWSALEQATPMISAQLHWQTAAEAREPWELDHASE